MNTMNRIIVIICVVVSNLIGIATGYLIARPLTLKGMYFVADFKYHQGYQAGAKDYIGTGWTVTRANIRCNSRGELDISGLDIYNATISVDEMKKLFTCVDNTDRML